MYAIRSYYASRKLGFTTKRTMMIAQQLYEGIDVGGKGAVGLISYIRTDSVRIASEAQQAARAYIGERFGSVYVPEKPNFYKGRDGAQDAHEAIRPTSVDHEPAAINVITSYSIHYTKLYETAASFLTTWAISMATRAVCSRVDPSGMFRIT